MITKRETLLGGLCTIMWVGGSCACHANVSSRRELGCYVPAEDAPSYFAETTSAQRFQFGSEQIEPRSGNRDLDYALAQALAKLAQTFDVLPGFAYYRDDKGSNALATPEPLLQRTDGTVLFGLNMLRELLGRPEHPDASVVAVCAHEFGHIVSYKNGMIRQLAPNRAAPFRAEQFADYIAGYFAGFRRLEKRDYPAVVFAQTQASYGGSARGTHGTRDERAEAVVQGFKAAFERKLSFAEAVRQGFQFAIAR